MNRCRARAVCRFDATAELARYGYTYSFYFGMTAEGRLVVTGGVIGWDVDGHLPADFIAQVRQTLRNIAAILEAGDARPEHLVRLTWYVVDMDKYLASLKALGQVYREVFGTHYPAMALVQVVRLVEKAAKVEIEATAVVPR